MLALPPLSLYVHLPWCVKKCPYCDFNSHVSQEIPEPAYLESLLSDLQAELGVVQGRSLRSIFFGGGTPSLMSSSFYQRLLARIAACIDLDPEIEITLEANPGASEAARFVGYREAGINRLSVGVQSFQPDFLASLGRVHSADEALKAVEWLKQAGFDNFNIDLMHGLPGQTPDLALADLEQAMALNPTHLSWYQLTIEQNTEFFSRPPPLPNEDTLWEIQQGGAALLAARGFMQYEVSAYAQHGKQAKHNMNYWTFGDYIGIGAGAHSKITDAQSGDISRYRKTRTPKDYMKPKPEYRVGLETVEAADLPFEFMMNALRLNKGVDESLFSARTGLTFDEISPTVSRLREDGLMEASRLQLTETGRRYLNSVLERFV